MSRFGLLFLSCAIVACAQTHKPASTAGAAAIHSSSVVQTNIESAKQNIQNAAAATEAAGKDASGLRSALDILDRKQVLTRRWLELQP